MAEEYVVIPPVEHQQVTTSSQVATVPRVATVFRASLGATGGQSTSPQQHSVYRQVNRIPVVTGSRTSGSSSSFQSSPPRKVPVVYAGRPATVTPSSARPTVQYQRSSAPGHLGIKRPLEYDFSLNKKFGHSRSTDKSKGLRHFSTKVCEKVKEKGRTNYNEVADELVQEYFESLVAPGQHVKIYDKQTYDMKNIRRRVYDALNVLMAMNIIEKEKKEIRWVGLPTSSIQECKRLEEEKAKRLVRIKQKAEQVEELIVQLVAYKSLVERNRNLERNQGRPPQNTLLYLPYVVVNTDKKTMIDCSISHDKTEYLFNFDQPFEIHDDIEVLKRLGLAHGLEKQEVADENIPKVKSYIPEALREYVDQILEGKLAGGGQEQTQPSHKIVLTAIKRPAKSSQEKIQGLAPQARAQKHPQYITLPSASHLKDPAHDYGQSGAFTQYTQALSTHSLARYAALQPTGTQKGESTDLHTYSTPSGGATSGFGDGVGQRPVAFVVSGSGQRTPTGVGGSYQGENQWQSGGESDYSDMDSLGSNSNQGF